MHTNRYTFIYATVLSALTAIILAFTAEGLKSYQEANIALDTKTNILRSVRETATDRATIEKKYAANITEMVLDGQGNILENTQANSVNLKDEEERKRRKIARKVPQINIKQLGSTRRVITRNPAIFRRLVGKSGHRGHRRHHHRHHRQAKGRGHHVHRHLQGSNASRNVHRFYHRPAQVVNPRFAGRVINQPVRRTFKRVLRPASQFKGNVIGKVNGFV